MLTEFVPGAASREEWQAFHTLRRAEHQETRPDRSPEPDDAAEVDLTYPDSTHELHFYLEWRDGQAVGRLRTRVTRAGTPEYESNKHLMWASGWVLPSHRRHAIASGWLPPILDRMDAHGARVLSANARVEDGHGFLHWLGAERKLTERISRLDLRQLDWSMVERWIEEGEGRSPDSRLHFYPHRNPSELIPELCQAFTDLLNTMPFEDQDHGDIVMTPEQVLEAYAKMDATGASNDTCVIRDPDGSIVALSDVFSAPHEPEFIDQGFTGVRPDARGRGLGKWVKAAMLARIRRRYPRARWIITGNAHSNDPMLAINDALGFRPTRMVTVYQVDRDVIAEKIVATPAAT
jgi:mycothiol synthase